MTQFLDDLLVSLYKSVLQKTNKILAKNVPLSLKMLGRYCMPYAWEPLIFPAIRNELAAFYSWT